MHRAVVVQLASVTISPETPTLSRIYSGTLLGLKLQLIEVEVALRRGPPQFQLAGLAEASVREARVRVASALSTLGLRLDEHAVTVSLAPAHLRKGGGGLDLALATAILEAGGRLPAGSLGDALVIGELALDGSVRPVAGVLPLLEGARQQGLRRAFLPADNLAEAAEVPGIEAAGVSHLMQLARALSGGPALPLASAVAPRVQRPTGGEFDGIRGQEVAKRALVLAAAGHHHLLLLGPPGAGKSLLARALPRLLPELDTRRALETTAIHSVAGLLEPGRGLVHTPPFRAPHHTVSEAALVGGGATPRPGELSLAHHGVLFLDELPEFRRSALEALRAPLEDHRVCLSRAKYNVTFPARPLLVCAMNPCACGHFGNPRIACTCSLRSRRKYLAKISGPLLERLDLHLAVQPVDVGAWAQRSQRVRPPEGDAAALVQEALARQRERQRLGDCQGERNADLSLEEAERVCQLDSSGRSLLAQASDRLGLSARSYVRVLRVARTIADLANAEGVKTAHLAEALQYRMLSLDGGASSPLAHEATPPSSESAQKRKR